MGTLLFALQQERIPFPRISYIRVAVGCSCNLSHHFSNFGKTSNHHPSFLKKKSVSLHGLPFQKKRRATGIGGLKNAGP
jgi:hypothetical protein